MSGSVIHLPSGAEKKPLRVIGEVIHVLADATQTGSFEVFVQQGPEGVGPPPHSHPWDEAYFMLDGEMDVLLGDRTVVLKPGDFVHIPAGCVHRFCYRGTSGRFLSVNSRAGASAFFRELDSALPDGAFDLPRMIDIALRNKVTPAGPPPG